jgi:hypothetical protein
MHIRQSILKIAALAVKSMQSAVCNEITIHSLYADLFVIHDLFANFLNHHLNVIKLGPQRSTLIL